MPHKKKATTEEIIRVIHAYLSEEIELKDAAQQLQVHTSTIRRWIRHYKAEGIQFFMPHEHNRVYSAELKMKAVLSYLNGEGGYMFICQKYKIRSTCQLRDWIKLYNAHGDLNSRKHSGGGSYMSTSRNTTQEERLQIVKESLASGRNYGEVAQKYNVSYQQVRNWTLRYEKMGEAGLEDRRGRRKKGQKPRTELEKAQIEIEKLKHQLYMAEMERDLLKKLQELERRDRLGK